MLNAPADNALYDLRSFPALVARLCDLGDRRIADMDEAGIDVQVLS